ncbi:hypothetical protein EUGRSUZ_G02251 [Eucalyptus grandis]|uniref:Uncharacterized protein n=2 Tax=Eucalyptus grandis TaxID=71139 RepID=A0ACC3K5H0_EUCGR|nr:hypothetical protein EUGRSUZ_G02251 [Eucalyptus grandis]
MARKFTEKHVGESQLLLLLQGINRKVLPLHRKRPSRLLHLPPLILHLTQLSQEVKSHFNLNPCFNFSSYSSSFIFSLSSLANSTGTITGLLQADLFRCGSSCLPITAT